MQRGWEKLFDNVGIIDTRVAWEIIKVGAEREREKERAKSVYNPLNTNAAAFPVEESGISSVHSITGELFHGFYFLRNFLALPFGGLGSNFPRKKRPPGLASKSGANVSRKYEKEVDAAENREKFILCQ